ncbi:MAG: hypothetical protein C0624_10780 [Desulfuromonas sp.]|nr:MAG: hypothetical protein C0624_10780 [Desulfuromonas sp.]
MANLLITNDCPRDCTFCFAKSRLGKAGSDSPAQIMSREKLRYIMDFLEKTGDKQFRLLGGEPTHHPEFKEIVTEALERGFHVHVFSNAMMPKETADFLADIPQGKISFLCNVSPQACDAPADKEKVSYALEKLGGRAQVGITLTEPEFEYEFLIEMINRYKLRPRIRIGIAQPIVGEDNDFLKPADYKATGTNIVAMAEDCASRNIMIGFDCGMTHCMFTEEEMGRLMMKSEGFRSVCEPIIDVGPNLDVWHCFPLSEVLNTRLDKYDIRADVTAAYRKKASPYRAFGCMAECLNCKHRKWGQCSGGCMAHAMNSLDKMPPRQI